MLTAAATTVCIQARPAQISQLAQPKPCTNFAERRDFIVSVINGQVITTPRTSVSLNEDGTMTIPLLDQYC